MTGTRWFILVLFLSGIAFAVPTGLSIEINSGDDYTDDTSVSLDLSATGAENCSLSNDAGFDPNTTYEYSSLPSSWDLESGDGSKTVYFKCVDSGGNWSSDVSDDITLDTEAPEASSKTPTGSVSDRTPEISADLSDDGSGVDDTTIELRVDGDLETHDYSGGEVSYTPSSDLDFGSHDVELVVSDEVGNELNTSWSFTIASEGVGFEDFEPEDESFITDKTPDVSVTLVDTGSGINESTLVMEFDDEDVSDDADYSSSSKVYSYDPSSLSDGNYTVEVWVEDNAGEESHAKWSFYVDTEPPELSLFVPEEDAFVSSVPDISVRIEDDGSGVDEDTIRMKLNGIDVTSSADYDPDDGDLEFTPSVELTPGTYDVEVWVDDNAENDVLYEWTFTIESTAPTISSFAPSDGSTTTNPRPEISAKITDPGTSGIDWDTIKLYIDGSVKSGVTYNAGSGRLYYTPDEDLEDGEHTLEVRVKNNYREESTAEWSFTIDSSAPVPPTGFTATQNESGTYLSWVLSTTEDIEEYIIYGATTSFTSVEGKVSLDRVDSDTNEYFHDTTDRYYYALVAEDESGNEAEPVFAGTCDEYSATDGWTDYECCVDSECLSGYYCDLDTHVCRKSTGTEEEVDAEDVISEAEDIIDTAKEAGKNVTEAENYLEEAHSAFNAGNYEQAEHFAELAKESALAAPELPEAEEAEKKGLPCCSSGFILLTVLGFIAFGRK